MRIRARDGGGRGNSTPTSSISRRSSPARRAWSGGGRRRRCPRGALSLAGHEKMWRKKRLGKEAIFISQGDLPPYYYYYNYFFLNKTQVTRTTHTTQEPPHHRKRERNTRPNHLAAIGGRATTVRATSLWWGLGEMPACGRTRRQWDVVVSATRAPEYLLRRGVMWRRAGLLLCCVCVCVFARVLVAPNLYLHTCNIIQLQNKNKS